MIMKEIADEQLFMPATCLDPQEDWLFSYGTLLDPEVQKIIFGYCCSTREALLAGWAVYASSDDGYLFIKPAKHGIVTGRILRVDTAALRSADLWEEVPLYRREKVLVTVDDGTGVEAWTYTRRTAAGEIYSGRELSTVERHKVLAAAMEMKKRLAAT